MNIPLHLIRTFAVVVLSFVTSSAFAGYIQSFSGDTRAETTGGATTAAGEFAVLDRLSGASSPSDIFGTGLAGFDSQFVAGGGAATFDTSARYLYLYQLVMSPSSTGTLSGFFVGGSRATPITSYEQWSMFLADNGGIVSTSNDFGTDNIAYTTTAPANLGVTNPAVSISGPISSLDGMSMSFTGSQFLATFNSQLAASQITRLFGYTSNVPPQLVVTPSTSSVAGNTLPFPTPEPCSSLLLAAGVAAIVLRGRRCHPNG